MMNRASSLPIAIQENEKKSVLGMQMVRVGSLLDAATAKKRRRYGINVFEFYIEEILSHAGVAFTELQRWGIGSSGGRSGDRFCCTRG